MEKIFFYSFFYICVKLHKIIIKCSLLLNPFVGIAKMWQGFSNQNIFLLDYYIIHICIMLNKDINHYLLQNFSENYFPNFHHDAQNLKMGIKSCQIVQ
jgi:hypothetical protein